MGVAYFQLFKNGLECGPDHWHGTIWFRGHCVPVRRTLRYDDAELLNELETDDSAPDWGAGDSTNVFLYPGSVRIRAIESYWKMFPEARMLIDGDPRVAGPQEIMDARYSHNKMIDLGTELIGNELYEAAKAIDFWEQDVDAMQEICEKWSKLLRKVRTSNE